MDNNGTPGSGLVASIVSVFSGIMAWISLKDTQVIITIIAGMVGIASGIFAIRYYIYATREKKQNLKK
jgi:uncharacterized membrane-anchored protein